MRSFQSEKHLVASFHAALEIGGKQALDQTLDTHLSEDHHWRGMYPFLEQHGRADLASVFWEPFLDSFTALQRRTDIFFAGENSVGDTTAIWICSMGNFMGLHDKDWLGIPATGKIKFMRFAEFNRVANGKIVETALFLDILGIMHQSGVYPLGPSTGEMFAYPGPRTQDGLLRDDAPAEQGEKTLQVVESMVADLSRLNQSDSQRMPASELAKSWHDEMVWYGPYGIGATYTIERYQEQHQYPFRLNLADKKFLGHVARFGEGNYAGFFGWPNLEHRPTGGFMGLVGHEKPVSMRIVDVYRREGDKLAENWVFIDMLWYLKQQGLDVLERMRQIRRIEPV
ncbi:hypothetical protein ACFQ14_16220 [Pseudahrensia aquimaris]|uniref:Polyketide cyclase n=1 Tax=Pseudahrensia aquimaris TaxID=744461 RepID=A0ABW3FML0_9HYPH